MLRVILNHFHIILSHAEEENLTTNDQNISEDSALEFFFMFTELY